MKLSQKQTDILDILQEGDRPMRPTEIGEEACRREVSWVGWDEQGVTSACDRLGEKGLVFNRAGQNVVLFFADEKHDGRAVDEITEFLLEQRRRTQHRQRHNSAPERAYRASRRELQLHEREALREWLDRCRAAGIEVNWRMRDAWRREYWRQADQARQAGVEERNAERERRRRQREADEKRRQAERERRRRTRIARESIASPVRLDAPLRAAPDLSVGDTIPAVTGDPLEDVMASELERLTSGRSIAEIEQMNDIDLARLRRRIVAAGFNPPSVQRSERERLRDPIPHRGMAA